MAGSLVPHCLAGAKQCVFLLSANCPVWAVRRCFDVGIPWQALGMGKDEGLALFQKTCGCLRILREIRKKDGNTHEKQQSDHARICKLVAWYSRTVLPREQVERRVASEDCYNTRAYFSLGKILEYVREDCQGNSPATPNFEFFRGFSPRAGPAEQDDGGIENGRFEGIPLW